MISTIKEIWASLDKKEKRYLKLGLKLIIIFGIIFTVIFPIVLTQASLISWLDFSNKGGIGDTINGIAGPFIALLAAILTFLAFYIQYKSNLQQRQQFNTLLANQDNDRKEQEKIWRIERFENRYYELIKIHKSNVAELNIENRITNRDCFEPLFYELRYIYTIVDMAINILKENYGEDVNISGNDKAQFAYTIFYYGIGYYSEKNYQKQFTNEQLKVMALTINLLETIQQYVISFFFQATEAKYFESDGHLMNNKFPKMKFYYTPFEGHMSRLGHYFRHLYQSANFVIQKEDTFLSPTEKFDYLKTLRGQLSNFEQLLLYYNALAWYRNQWHTLFTEYRFIKNLPLPLADFGVRPEEYFAGEILILRSKGIEMFELHE